jgi:hypothetical protein
MGADPSLARGRRAAAGLSRRAFLKAGALTGSAVVAGLELAGSADACDLPVTGAGWPSVDGWQHRTLMHFLNTVFPGDTGQALFPGDGYPLRSGADTTPGAWSACALDVIYDPYYGIAGTNARLMAGLLDWSTRLHGYAWYFYQASQVQQLRVVDALSRPTFIGRGFTGAAALGLAAVLGAIENDSVTQLIGWGGPNAGYYGDSRHPIDRWRQPARMTTDGNLP